MTTRFDTTKWTTAKGDMLAVKEMETEHLLNVLKMLVQKPTIVVSMLICDIEAETSPCYEPWTKEGLAETKFQSLHNATSMSADEILEYVLTCRLGTAMLTELSIRGINVDRYLILLRTAR